MSLDPPPTARELRAMAEKRGVLPPSSPVAPRKRAEATDTPSVLTLTLPMPVNLANARLHWAVKDKRRRRYFDMCDGWCAVHRSASGNYESSPPPSAPITPAVITMTLLVWNYMDDDNAMARVKWPLDWLVSRGYIAGDSRRHLRWSGIPEQRIDRHRNSSITLTLTPIPSAPWEKK